MNPIFGAILIGLTIFGMVALGLWLGHVTANWLSKTTAQTLGGRLVRDYRLWAPIAGLCMCGALMGMLVHVLVAIGMLVPMCFALMVADHLEPEPERCTRCGR